MNVHPGLGTLAGRGIAALSLALTVISCGGSPTTRAIQASGEASLPPKPPTEQPPVASELADHAPVAFRANFAERELGAPWNVFGQENGTRSVEGGPAGLRLKIVDAQKAWDAVSARTSTLKVDGDFDLRGRYRDFSATGNGSTKLVVVDASRPRGEAAYVERIQIDGKNLLKFGGEVEGSLENWGFVPTDATAGDLRIARVGNVLHAFARADERAPWTEFAPAMQAPRSMPRVVKFGMKLSAESHKSAQVLWADLTINGQLIRTE